MGLVDKCKLEDSKGRASGCRTLYSRTVCIESVTAANAVRSSCGKRAPYV